MPEWILPSLDLLNDDDEQTTQEALNVNAAPFVPRASKDELPASPTAVDHVASEDDATYSEQWPEEAEWYYDPNAQWATEQQYTYEQPWAVADPNANQWMHPHAQYQAAGVDVNYWWQQQMIMEQSLYQPPPMPKGNTYSRARSQQARWQ